MKADIKEAVRIMKEKWVKKYGAEWGKKKCSTRQSDLCLDVADADFFRNQQCDECRKVSQQKCYAARKQLRGFPARKHGRPTAEENKKFDKKYPDAIKAKKKVKKVVEEPVKTTRSATKRKEEKSKSSKKK